MINEFLTVLVLSAHIGTEPIDLKATATTKGVFETCIEIQSSEVELTSCWDMTDKTPPTTERFFHLQRGDYKARLVVRMDEEDKEGNANWRVTPWQQLKVLQTDACELIRQQEHRSC